VKRNWLDICADLVRVARGGAKKTQLVYQANLNFEMIKRYLALLIEGGLIVEESPYYTTTERGEEFLHNYELLNSNIQLS